MDRNLEILNQLLERGHLNVDIGLQRHHFIYGRPQEISQSNVITIKTVLSTEIMDDLTSNFVRWMLDWVATSESLDVGRFHGVRLIRYNQEQGYYNEIGYELSLEFRLDSYTEPDRSRTFILGNSVDDMDYFYELWQDQQKYSKQKIDEKKDHFNKDLFEI